MKNKFLLMVFLLLLVVLSACSLPIGNSPNSPDQQVEITDTSENPNQDSSSASTTASISLTVPPSTPSSTVTVGIPILTLDGNYYCNVGPGANYNRIIIYPNNTKLQIVGWNGGGWYLVKMIEPQGSRTSCWIGGGIASGNLQDIPIPAPVPAVPAHDPTNWSNVVLLTCPELSTYEWTWGGSSSGEYASLTSIIGIVNATIVYDEYHPICPAFSPFLKVPIYDLDAGTRLGYISCSEVSALGWFWNISPGRWISSSALFGSNRATYVATEMSMNCPSLTTTKVVPVHGASWEIIGFLGCPELGTYTWNPGINSGEYIASTTLYGSNYATIYYEEFDPACPSFSP